MPAYQRARELIDAAHDADPHRTTDGRAAERVYADRMEAWLMRLVPDAPAILRLAARCQHLERWTVPRATFPMDRPGYLKWRRHLYEKQGGRTRELLLAAGVSQEESDAAHDWVAKKGLGTNAGTQALEDAAVLVFLENELAAFAAQHAEYPREKFVTILRKSWLKLSPDGRRMAVGIPLDPAMADLVREAVGPESSED